MKRDFLESLGLEKDAVDKIMAENGADLEKEKSRTAALMEQKIRHEF